MLSKQIVGHGTQARGSIAIRGICVVFISTIIALLISGPSHSQVSEQRNIEVPYFLLGMLEEYMGRVIDDNSDLVESFYPNEKSESDCFGYYLELLKDEHSPSAVIRKEIDSNGFIRFYSKDLKEVLNSYYKQSDLEMLGRDSIGYLDKQTFKMSCDEAGLSYLAGVCSRYLHSGMIHLNNGHRRIDKAELIAFLLLRIGCSEVKINVGNHVPTQIDIEFSCSSDYDTVLTSECKKPQ